MAPKCDLSRIGSCLAEVIARFSRFLANRASFARARCMSRELHRLRLHRRIDDEAAEVRRLCRANARGDIQALLKERDDLVFAHALKLARHRGAVEGNVVTKERLVTKQLITAFAQSLVRPIERALEERQSRHRPRRQRRPAGNIGVDRPEFALKKSPVDLRASFANAWFRSTIWSRRNLNKSFCPRSRRSFGSIAISPTQTQPKTWNHADSAKSNCKKIDTEIPKTGDIEYLHNLRNHSARTVSAFFTGD